MSEGTGGSRDIKKSVNLGGSRFDGESAPLPKLKHKSSRGSGMTGRGLFGGTQAEVRRVSSEAQVQQSPSEVTEYFRGRELPTDVWIPTGAVYYREVTDIPEETFPKADRPPQIDKVETDASVAREVCPPREGESPDASFKFIGDRGLYVRVIVGKSKRVVAGKSIEELDLRWVPFNEEDVDPKKIRYT